MFVPGNHQILELVSVGVETLDRYPRPKLEPWSGHSNYGIHCKKKYFKSQSFSALRTESFLIPIYLQLNVVDFFKLRILFSQVIKVQNIKILHHQVTKIKVIENLSLWQRLHSLFKVYKVKFGGEGGVMIIPLWIYWVKFVFPWTRNELEPRNKFQFSNFLIFATSNYAFRLIK